jgi:putative oxidoreductase
MNAINRIQHWADAHHPLWLDIIRIALGVFIIYKGVYFISHTDTLVGMMQSANLAFATMAMAHYVAFAHLVGGFLIAIGLLTRVAILFQLPILLGAVIFVNPQGMFSVANNLELEISIVVLILLIVFLVYGSGRLSVSEYMRKHPNW